MGRSIGVALYLAISELSYGPAIWILNRRLQNGKEDPTRYTERLGDASIKRPKGPLIWFHAASVGEALSLLDLINAILNERDDVNVLLTSGTTTSAEILALRLPDRAYHQFVPLDSARAVRRFLRHWKPNVAVWTESEMWPALMHLTHKSGCPMLLVNGRISRRSARRLKWLGSYAKSLLARFEVIMTEDERLADRFFRLGVNPEKIEVTGSLKDTAMALPYNENQLKQFSKVLGGKQVWLAASTHKGEEKAVAEAHRYAKRTAHGLILILAPRHPDRGPEIARDLRAQGWRVAQRSANEPMARDTEIYLADTMGEMGLWYRLAPISFVGGSLVDVGGHNPFEPALLGSAILHGPNVYNFESAYDRFAQADASVVVSSSVELGPMLVETLPADRTASLAQAAWRVSSEGIDVADYIHSTILAQLPGTSP